MNRINILLAEDDLDDYQFFVEALTTVSPAYSVTRVKNGLDCICYLKKEKKPDLIFLDLNMPLKNGLECLSYIKENQELSDTPVVIYSTSHYIKHIDAAFKKGAHHYIVKPNDLRDLVEILSYVTARLDGFIPAPCKENFVVRILTPEAH